MLRVNLLARDGIPRTWDDAPRIVFPELGLLRGQVMERRGCTAVAVTGPAGAGKTAFLHQARAVLAELGYATIMTGALPEHVVCDPRLSLREWWQLAAGAGLPPQGSAALRQLESVLPAGIEHLPPALRRECIAERLWTALRDAAAGSPMAVLVDDAPLLGETAARVLERALAAAAREAARMVFVIAADTAWMQRARHQDLPAVHIALRGFSAADLAGVAPLSAAGPRLRERFIERTGGLPQYALNALAVFRETGAEKLDGLVRLCAEAPADLVRTRLELLSEERRETLALLAACARPLSVAFVRRVLGRQGQVLDAQLGALERAGFIRRAGPARVTASDRLVRRIVCEMLAPEGLEALHGRIADVLENDGGLWTEIAMHRSRAGAAGGEHVARAVEELCALGQPEDAAALGSVPPESPAADGAVLAALALAVQGSTEAAWERLRTAPSAAGPYPAWQRGAYGGRIAAAAGRPDEARALLAEAEALAAQSGFAPLRGRSLLLAGEALLVLDDRAAASRALHAACGALEGASPRLAAQSCLCLASLAVQEDEFHQALSWLYRVVEDLEDPVDEAWPGPSENAGGGGAAPADCGRLLEGGDPDAAQRAFMTLVASSSGDRIAAARGLLDLADLLVSYDNDSLALACVAEALKSVRGGANEGLLARARLASAKVSILVGDYGRAFASLAGAFRGVVLAYDRAGLGAVCLAYARLLRMVGVPDLAARWCAMSRVLQAQGGGARMEADSACEKAWILLAQERRGEAVRAALQAGGEGARVELERKLVLAAAQGGDEGLALAQEVRDAAKVAGIQDLAGEAALILGRAHGRRGEHGLLRATEIMQGVAELALQRKRPELGVRAKIAMGELFLARKRQRPAREFLRAAAEDLARLQARVPRAFRTHFMAKREYRAAAEAAGGALSAPARAKALLKTC
ncbi:MAG TPA: hypothetical protein PKX48_09535 [Planctomycetota bacterium]|jgi:hypothetical protein|nr:hypothetical protein [Planctomycetota bacterium]OQC19808.1 MAG: hypothetical protein BWX69_02385 [Planctomycetes bacterium ADurb.Bin069]HNS00106.1 hypothetical protein [Planctomycetota bacterium]HNU26617.1 hypothetical protein [Planctomycetota bacterium]HOE30204.1 hypothetical protein [Planctomycetota bacterium]